MEDHVNVNPLKPTYSVADKEGVDLRCHIDEIPLFWRKHISEVKNETTPEEHIVTAFHNRAVYEMASASSPHHPGDFRELVPAAFKKVNNQVPLSAKNPTLKFSPALRNLGKKLRNYQKQKAKHSVIFLDYELLGRESVLTFGESVKNNPDIEVVWVSMVKKPTAALLRTEAQFLDVVLDCHFEGDIHKGIALNAALAEVSGEVITVCDLAYAHSTVHSTLSTEVLKAFFPDNTLQETTPQSAVLEVALYEVQTRFDNRQIVDPRFIRTWHRACLSFRKADAIAFGGFDEHPSLAGFCGGAFELCSRMTSHGIPLKEIDQPELFHFFSLPFMQLNGVTSVIKERQDRASAKLPTIESPHIEKLRLQQ